MLNILCSHILTLNFIVIICRRKKKKDTGKPSVDSERQAQDNRYTDLGEIKGRKDSGVYDTINEDVAGYEGLLPLSRDLTYKGATYQSIMEKNAAYDNPVVKTENPDKKQDGGDSMSVPELPARPKDKAYDQLSKVSESEKGPGHDMAAKTDVTKSNASVKSSKDDIKAEAKDETEGKDKTEAQGKIEAKDKTEAHTYLELLGEPPDDVRNSQDSNAVKSTNKDDDGNTYLAVIP